MPNLNLKNNNVLVRPRITEKAAIHADKNNVYVFEVTRDSNKASIAASVKARYKVTPVRIRVTPIPEKKVFIRGKHGVKTGGKKAYVYLKKGNKIELL
ncbi:MAG: 50S ribosomal protein L23 [Patescibacteria group bacterium]